MKQPLLNIPKAQVPTFHEIAHFSKKSNLFIACFWLSFPLLLTAMLLWGLFKNLVLEKPFPVSDWIPPLVILLPLLPFTVPYFLQEKRRHKELKAGTSVIGAFFSQDVLLWCTFENVYQFIPADALHTVEIGRYPGSGTGPRIAGWLKMSGPDFCLKIEDVYDYDTVGLVHFLRSWKPTIVFAIDTTLTNYHLYEDE